MLIAMDSWWKMDGLIDNGNGWMDRWWGIDGREWMDGWIDGGG
jgi:hypothetical protein